MATFTKNNLSASTNGLPISVTATSTVGTLIHTAIASTDVGTWDELWIYATNQSVLDVILTLEWGSVATTLSKIITVPAQAGELLIAPGFILHGGLVVGAFAPTTAVISLTGYVNSITA